MYLKQKIPRSSFLSFFDDFRYAGATIVALCSQGLRSFDAEFNSKAFEIMKRCSKVTA